MEQLTPKDWDHLRGCRPPGWNLGAASWDTSADEPTIRVDVYPSRLAPLVPADEETPTVERADTKVIEGSGATRGDALDDACRKLQELAP